MCSTEVSAENINFAAENVGEEVRKLRICMKSFQAIPTDFKPTTVLDQPFHSLTMSTRFLASMVLIDTRRRGHYKYGEDRLPKLILHSMYREKPLRKHESSTLPMSGLDWILHAVSLGKGCKVNRI